MDQRLLLCAMPMPRVAAEPITMAGTRIRTLKRKLWIREEFLNHERPFQFFVVHGHTPVRAPEVRFNRVNIDTGAFATGRLTCVAIEGSTIAPL
jgi:hypothetical protein